MPAYYTLGLSPITAIYPGDQVLVFNAESPATGTKSQQLAIGSVYENAPEKLSVEISFSGAPGTFNLQIQRADTETDAAYITVGSGTVTTVNANNYASVDLIPFGGKFVRILVNAAPSNVVTTTVKITR